MLSVAPFHQRESHCGPACLRMIFKYFGVHLGQTDIARVAGTTSFNGTPMKAMRTIPKKFGFNVVYKEFATFGDIEKYVIDKKVPVIVNLFIDNENHYVVVIGLSRSNVFVQDPYLGHSRAIRKDVFMRTWIDFSGDYIKSKNDLRIRPMLVITPKKK